KQRVIDRDLIDKLPAGRSPFAQMALIPGVTVNATNQDVGGATQLSGAITMQVHGSTGNSQSLMENGLSTAALISPANSQITFNMAASQEIAVDYSGSRHGRRRRQDERDPARRREHLQRRALHERNH